MNGPVRRFELLLLRPLWVAVLAVAIYLAISGMWIWIAACVAALMYIGLIGATLHPRQSAADLAQGPLEGPAGKAEAQTLTTSEQVELVGKASTRVGLLMAPARRSARSDSSTGAGISCCSPGYLRRALLARP